MLLSNLSPTQSYIVIVGAHSILFGWLVWLGAGRLCKYLKTKHTMAFKIGACLVFVISFVLASPLYIDFVNNNQVSMPIPTFEENQKVLVHYGARSSDFFWTETSIDQLRNNPNTSLNMMGESVFTIRADGNILCDANIFAGFATQGQTVYPVTPMGDNFTIQMSGYFDTEASGIKKTFFKKVVGSGTKFYLLQPVKLRSNLFDELPTGWTKLRSNKALEIRNEDGLPVLVLVYNDPYKITISGLFLSPYGILKVDNSEDTIFTISDSIYDFDTYRVNRVFVRSVFDLCIQERSYNLADYFNALSDYLVAELDQRYPKQEEK